MLLLLWIKQGKPGRILNLFVFQEKKIEIIKLDPSFLDIVSVSPVISYWSRLFKNVNLEKIRSLPQKYFLTNKVKEVSFKIINTFYPAKYFMIKYKSNIDTRCSFCQVHTETVYHLFWSCFYTKQLWESSLLTSLLKIISSKIYQ